MQSVYLHIKYTDIIISRCVTFLTQIRIKYWVSSFGIFALINELPGSGAGNGVNQKVANKDIKKKLHELFQTLIFSVFNVALKIFQSTCFVFFPSEFLAKLRIKKIIKN